jgi:hypothetical protein
MEMHCNLTRLENNERLDVVLPWDNFTVWYKICDSGGNVYSLKYKREPYKVIFWYEPADCENVWEWSWPYGIFVWADKYVDDFSIPDKAFDDGPYVKITRDTLFESKLLCLEKIKKTLDKIPGMWSVVE